MNTSKISEIINSVRTTTDGFDKMLNATGAKFNIFNVLNLSSNETRTHSAFIAELLNPKGSHGRNTIFLKLFLNKFCDEKYFVDLDLNHYSVDIEDFIGQIDQENGGRIDIILKHRSGKAVIIENKIYAADQENQLLRYYNFGRNLYPNNFELFYLTLDGKEPTEFSTGDSDTREFVNEKVKNISYKKQIIEWLEDCHKESVEIASLREIILQYINLIRHLTGQTMNENLVHEISKKIINDGEESIQAVFNIRNSIYDKTIELLIANWKTQVTNLGSSLGLNVWFDEKFSYWDSNYCWYYQPKDWSNAYLAFGFEKRWLYYGVNLKNSDPVIQAFLEVELDKRLGNRKKDKDWPWWTYIDSYNDTESQLIDIHNGKLFNKIDEIVKNLLKQTEGINF